MVLLLNYWSYVGWLKCSYFTVRCRNYPTRLNPNRTRIRWPNFRGLTALSEEVQNTPSGLVCNQQTYFCIHEQPIPKKKNRIELLTSDPPKIILMSKNSLTMWHIKIIFFYYNPICRWYVNWWPEHIYNLFRRDM